MNDLTNRHKAKELIYKYHQYYYMHRNLPCQEMEDSYLDAIAQAVIDAKMNNSKEYFEILVILKDLQSLINKASDKSMNINLSYINDGFNRIIEFIKNRYIKE